MIAVLPEAPGVQLVQQVPVSGTTVSTATSGPESATLISGPSDADGVAEAARGTGAQQAAASRHRYNQVTLP